MIELKNVSYSYPHGQKYSVEALNFKIHDGEIALITGRSGCGKSTLVRLCNGLCPHYYGGSLHGEILIDNENLSSLGEISQISSHLGSLFQDPERNFFALNVEEELAFALQWQNLDPKTILERLEEVIARFKLESIREHSINSLSEGQKQKLGLATQIALGVKNLVLDEPTANLDVKSTQELTLILQKLASEGFCILIVDHRLHYLQALKPQVLVMDEGRIIKQGTYEILKNDQLQAQVPLRALTLNQNLLNYKEKNILNKNVILKGEKLGFSYKDGETIFKDFDFELKAGITLLLGENGLGKTTLCRLIFGLEKLQQGKFCFKDPHSICAMVLQNTDYQLHMRSVYEELSTSLILAGKQVDDKLIFKYLDEFNLKGLDKYHPQSLSGGQKQRLVLACALIKNPMLLILDEPTSGLDKANLLALKKLLKTFVENPHKAVLIITHDPELLDESYQILNLNQEKIK
ncbi:MAG: ABC transporter ATP-binding protein [Succinatimonas sp.]|nr:ABC transporter ATP-binding protein [Succinatimonas sp.]